jgi:hypothetical protein
MDHELGVWAAANFLMGKIPNNFYLTFPSGYLKRKKNQKNYVKCIHIDINAALVLFWHYACPTIEDCLSAIIDTILRMIGLHSDFSLKFLLCALLVWPWENQ